MAVNPRTIMRGMRERYTLPEGMDFRETAMRIFNEYKRNVAADKGGCLHELPFPGIQYCN